MRRWMWFAPVGLLTVFAGYMGFQLGQPKDEGAVIAHWAQVYASDYGGNPFDCTAQLSSDARVHMRISCIDTNGTGYLFDVDIKGRLLMLHPISHKTT